MIANLHLKDDDLSALLTPVRDSRQSRQSRQPRQPRQPLLLFSATLYLLATHPASMSLIPSAETHM
jgi:hypothetical protein